MKFFPKIPAKRRVHPFLVCSMLVVAMCAGQEMRFGKVVGTVLDVGTRQPIAGANVLVVGTSHGTVTANDGRFTISGVPVGTHTLRISCIGFKTALLADVVVGTGRPVQANAQLESEAVNVGGEVVVSGTYFSVPREVTGSAYGLNYEEIRRAPGALGDVQRMVQSMPGVVPTNDQRNDLVVRGGSPSENATIVDNVDVPNLSHFGTQGAGGGPISMLNTEFIQQADFLAGGFPAQYGGKLSSVLNVRLREGNREGLAGDVDLGMAGAGFILEGPLGTKGSWIATARRSFLDFIIKNYGMTAVPHYNNYQVKAAYGLDPSNKLWFVSLGGNDWITMENSDQTINEPSTITAHSEGWHVISGFTWQMLWGKRGYGTLGIADTYDVFLQDATDAFLGGRMVFSNRSREGATTLKYDAVLQLAGGSEITAGIAGRILRSSFDIEQPLGLSNVWAPGPGRIDTLSIDRTERTRQASAYLQWSGTLAGNLRAALGLRFDHFGYNRAASTFGPRLGLTFDVAGNLSLHSSFGDFSQMPPLVFLRALPGNGSLVPMRARHYAAGAAWFPAPDLKITLEGYVKSYRNYPVSRDHPVFSLANAGEEYSIAGYLFPLESLGSGVSRGVELYVQKKLTDNLYGQVSYSRSHTVYTALDGVARPGSFDIPHVLSVVGGWKISESWEFSTKFTYASGRPRTPLDLPASRAWNRQIFDFTRTNAGRMPAYHRLDLRADYRAHFAGWNLVTYLELQNVYDRNNVFMYVWNELTREENVIHQIAFFPVGGFRVEF